MSVAEVHIVSLSPDDEGDFISHFLSVDTTSQLHAPDEIWNRLVQVETRGDHYHGFIQDYLWAGITLKNASQAKNWILELQNPHVNHIHVYIREHSSSEWITHSKTGRTTQFHTRAVPHFNFAFDITLPQNDKIDVLFMLDKRRSSLNYPIRVYTNSYFTTTKQRNYAFIGMYFGVFGIVIFVTLVAYTITRRSVYFWYLCYVSTLGLFIFTDIGLAHQFIYPTSATLGGDTRVFLSYILMITFNVFTITYFDTRNTLVVLHRVLLGLTFILVGIALVHLFFTDFTRENATYVLFILYTVIITSFSIAILIAFKYLKIERYTAYLFITAFSFILIAGTLFILTEFGFLNRPNVLFTPIQIGSLLEIIFLSGGLAWQVRVVEKKRQLTLQKVRALENENLRAYIDGTERERIRVAMDLHDDIGSKLGQLRRNVEKRSFAVEAISDDIQHIVEDLRFISHKLSPQGLRITGLEDSVRYLVSQTNKNSPISYTFQVVDIPNNMSETMTVQLFRIIQEAIQNIEKHSEADRADIQIIYHDTELVLTIEDNGKGFPITDEPNHGIGIENIKKRVAILGGEVSFFSQPGGGVSILVGIPH
ncbi:MAG: hypothetical protein LAT57_02235 [Balneolales bacterium]|nr:hypothetical protein [Balneolales bacterium]